ncbi:MAG: DUF2269 family protein [Acidimicrobiia bacterium]
MTLRNILLFIHLLAAFTWIGGAILLNILGRRALRSGDPEAAMGIVNTSDFAAKAVFNPAGGIVLLAGIALVLESDIFDFGMAWILFAIAVVVGSAILGGVFYGRRIKQLYAVAEERGPSDPAIPKSVRTILNVANVEALFLLAVAWVMVFKPGA